MAFHISHVKCILTLSLILSHHLLPYLALCSIPVPVSLPLSIFLFSPLSSRRESRFRGLPGGKSPCGPQRQRLGKRTGDGQHRHPGSRSESRGTPAVASHQPAAHRRRVYPQRWWRGGEEEGRHTDGKRGDGIILFYVFVFSFSFIYIYKIFNTKLKKEITYLYKDLLIWLQSCLPTMPSLKHWISQ